MADSLNPEPSEGMRRLVLKLEKDAWSCGLLEECPEDVIVQREQLLAAIASLESRCEKLERELSNAIARESR